MLYTIPDYYHEFTCVAGKCEDTCCAGWQIVADEAALERYRNETGAFAKAQMAVVSTLLIHELLMAQWMKQEKVLDINDVIDTVYRYSRELEHSDSNLNLIQELLQESNE